MSLQCTKKWSVQLKLRCKDYTWWPITKHNLATHQADPKPNKSNNVWYFQNRETLMYQLPTWVGYQRTSHERWFDEFTTNLLHMKKLQHPLSAELETCNRVQDKHHWRKHTWNLVPPSKNQRELRVWSTNSNKHLIHWQVQSTRPTKMQGVPNNNIVLISTKSFTRHEVDNFYSR